MKNILISGLYSFIAGAATVLVLIFSFDINSELLVSLAGILVSSSLGAVQLKRTSFVLKNNTMQSYGQKGGEMNLVQFVNKK